MRYEVKWEIFVSPVSLTGEGRGLMLGLMGASWYAPSVAP